jgi:hypothetical protein
LSESVRFVWREFQRLCGPHFAVAAPDCAVLYQLPLCASDLLQSAVTLWRCRYLAAVVTLLTPSVLRRVSAHIFQNAQRRHRDRFHPASGRAGALAVQSGVHGRDRPALVILPDRNGSKGKRDNLAFRPALVLGYQQTPIAENAIRVRVGQ